MATRTPRLSPCTSSLSKSSRRWRCSGGIGSPHRSQCSWAASAAALAAFSDSSAANRRSEEKVEKAFLLPCSTMYPSAHRARQGDLHYASPTPALSLLDICFAHEQ